MILKQYRRGSVSMLSALAALSVIVSKAINQALTIVDRINSGEISVEAGTIIETVLCPIVVRKIQYRLPRHSI
jgi:hypothetical protein